MAEEGGLRWWQEETPAPGAYTSPPLAAPALVSEAANIEATADLWDELEAEAQARAVAEAQGERVVIPFDSQLNMRRLRRRLLLVAPLLLLFCVLIAFIEPVMAVCAALFLLIECIVIYAIMKQATLRQTQPAVVLSREGMKIHLIGHDIGLVRWDEIAEIRTYNLWPYRYVGIVPKDTPALCKRLGKKATLIRANDWCLRWLYRPLRVWCAPINIPQQNLPITADSLLARIAAFEAGQK